MSSAKMHDYLLGSWQMVEGYSRKYAPGSMSPLPVTPEKQAHMDRIREAQRFADDHSDRETAAAFPDVVERACPVGFWDRIKPCPDDACSECGRVDGEHDAACMAIE